MRLIADIGGTNARFAQAGSCGRIAYTWSAKVADFASFDAALATYIDNHAGPTPTIAEVVVAGAGAVVAGAIAITNSPRNSPWVITAAALRQKLGAHVDVRLINDLEAVAHALPALGSTDVSYLDAVEPDAMVSRQRMLAVNIGTGFGTCCLIRVGGGWLSCPSESGHMAFAPQSDDLRRICTSVFGSTLTFEDILSGAGVQRLASELGGADSTGKPIDLAGSGEVERDVRGHITLALGEASAALVLATAAWGGVYLCGSVVNAWAPAADRHVLRQAFNGTGKMRDRLAGVPLGLITRADPAFLGMAKLDFAACPVV